jgi:hypothetical protein
MGPLLLRSSNQNLSGTLVGILWGKTQGGFLVGVSSLITKRRNVLPAEQAVQEEVGCS